LIDELEYLDGEVEKIQQNVDVEEFDYVIPERE
jgi:hypothetical protein